MISIRVLIFSGNLPYAQKIQPFKFQPATPVCDRIRAGLAANAVTTSPFVSDGGNTNTVAARSDFKFSIRRESNPAT